jgi:hypothetical protein
MKGLSQRELDVQAKSCFLRELRRFSHTQEKRREERLMAMNGLDAADGPEE